MIDPKKNGPRYQIPINNKVNKINNLGFPKQQHLTDRHLSGRSAMCKIDDKNPENV